MKRLTAVFLLLLILSGCARLTPGDRDRYKSEFFAMDTVMTITVYGDSAQDAEKACENEIYRLDNLLSTGASASEIAVLNTNGGGTVSDETAGLLRAAIDLYGLTDGAFDITVYPVVSAWGFYSGDYKVLNSSDLTPLLKLVGSDKLQLAGNTVTFDIPGMAVDLGGIGKGYASDRLRTVLQEQGITSALASLGGNVVAYGSKPDGSDWSIAVQDPDNPSGYTGILQVSDKMVITSGGYQRYFEMGGKTYHHIVDPRTGVPADSGLKSVTIVSEDGTTADGLSTALFIMGKDAAVEFWGAHRDLFDAVLETTDGQIYVTAGLRDSFSSILPFEVIE